MQGAGFDAFQSAQFCLATACCRTSTLNRPTLISFKAAQKRSCHHPQFNRTHREDLPVASIPTVDDQPVFVNDREQLIYLLSEAAEIEHGLMCSYLYAVWSLKQSTDEGLTAKQLEAVNGWRDSIQSVAIEEMLHLALVSNLLMSLGAPPHFSRPNFPITPGYHPSSIVVRLTPFNRDTADHFVYLERPEGMDLPRAKGFEAGFDYQRGKGGARLTPTAEDYDTVSHLYSGIEDGFRSLSKKPGTEALFLGDPQAQVTADVLPFPGLKPVTGLDSALAAIATIIEQGEGGRHDAEDSHFKRFCVIRDEYDVLLQHDPGFQPHRPIVSDPVMFHPIVDQGQVHVSAQPAARVLDLANACYGLMLRLLASGIGMASGDSAIRRVEIDSAIAVMSVMKSLALLLTALPAEGGAQTAGMNFHLPRSTLALPQRQAGTAMLAERAREIAGALDAFGKEVAGADRSLAARLMSIADRLLRAAVHDPG
jgi:hypothetical protein